MEYFERLDKISDYVSEVGRVSTSHLSEVFNVSEQTIRKDLKVLEKNKVIRRVHGGAEKAPSFDERLFQNTEAKKHLAQEAAKIIKDGDTIYIDGGTSYFYLIDYVPSEINITVVTASVPIAERIKTTTDQKVYLLGGIVNSTTLETYSPNAIQEVSTMIFNSSFFGVSGFSKEYAFTEENFYSLDLKRKVRENTKKAVVIAGSDKEGKVAFKKAFDFSEIDLFITEKNISEDLLAILEKQLDLITI